MLLNTYWATNITIPGPDGSGIKRMGHRAVTRELLRARSEPRNFTGLTFEAVSHPPSRADVHTDPRVILFEQTQALGGTETVCLHGKRAYRQGALTWRSKCEWAHHQAD